MNFWKISTFVFASLFAVSLGTIGIASAEGQPKMTAALKDLKSAKENLKNATADKGGHRVKAIALVDSAIDEVEKGIAYDDKH